MRNVQQTFTHIIEEVPYLPEELQMAVANLEEPSALSHLIAGALRIKVEEKQELLEEVDVCKRLRRLSEILARELDIVAIGSKIQSQVMSEMESSQREYVLRQQLKAIQEELGEKDPAEAEVDELREQLAEIELPEDVRKQSDRELSRLEKLPQAAAEHGVIRTYLEWIASLPWDKHTDDNLDLAHAREVLDSDHYDIAKVKERILEFLAVRKLKPDATGSSIMCFVGPPGVGKTSLGRSIARSMGRKFERISAGGVRDEAEIRGHRRTYIGAMPGTIIRALRDAGANNPLFMIDEIDKMGADYRGDPASRDARGARPRAELDVPRSLPRRAVRPLARPVHHDREHARHDPAAAARPDGDHPARRLHRGGEAPDRQALPRAAAGGPIRTQALASRPSPTPGLKAIISDYTREAGVRSLEREIGSACRKVALTVAEGTHAKKVSVTAPKVRELLGRPRFQPDTKRRTSEPGVATGLAWTPVGGDVLFVEATAMPGKGKLTITGQLGDVMKESAQAAMSYVRGHADLPDDWFATHDVHVHVPAGAIPKDGPSAGITMATALMSLVTGRPVRDDVAMTGELTLTGQVLPIGGLKEKALAAQRAGVKRVLAPSRNEGDLEDIPEALRKNLDFVWVSEIGDVFDAALANGRPGYARPS